MLWNHPGTQQYFTRPDDVLVELKHKNADKYRSEVIHIPQHVVAQIRPGKYAYRIDIQFRRTMPVTMPEDLANWILSKFPYVYKYESSTPSTIKDEERQKESDSQKTDTNKTDDLITLPVTDSSASHFDELPWNELTKIGRDKGLFKVGMNKDALIKALEGDNDLITGSNRDTATE